MRYGNVLLEDADIRDILRTRRMQAGYLMVRAHVQQFLLVSYRHGMPEHYSGEVISEKTKKELLDFFVPKHIGQLAAVTQQSPASLESRITPLAFGELIIPNTLANAEPRFELVTLFEVPPYKRDVKAIKQLWDGIVIS